MIKPLISLFLFFSISWLSQAQAPFIVSQSATPITADGTIGANEWDYAQFIEIELGSGQKVKVSFTHADGHLYFLFTGPLESSNSLFPEILLDMDHDTTTVWNTDDWWFHVSAQDCEWQGAYGNYNNCDTVQPDWIGSPNFTMGTPMTDTVEIDIPFSKIGLNSNLYQDTVGIALLVTNTFNNWKLWPADANQNSPVTWSSMVIGGTLSCLCPVIHPEEQGRIYPNPSNGRLNIHLTENPNENTSVTITDMSGRQLAYYNGQGKTDLFDINIERLDDGLYLVHLNAPNVKVTRRLILHK